LILSAASNISQKNVSKLKTLKKQCFIQGFVILGMLFLLIFKYIPMFGIVMGFKDYTITMGVKGIFTSKWVGFKHFKEFFTDYNFWPLVRNTTMLSVLKLVFTFPVPILFAILLNEMRSQRFKRFVQTVSYLPHFVSWVVVSGLVVNFLSTDRGVVNNILMAAGLIKKRIEFLSDPDYFWGLAVATDIWKDMGWWAIIFLAAITGIDPCLYEAAEIDGAGRLRKIWHITLPGIKGTITVVLILALGNLFGGGLSGSNFEQAFLLGNPMNSDKSEIIQTYVFEIGLSKGRYAYATAVGLIQSVISLILVFLSNSVLKRLSDGSSLF